MLVRHAQHNNWSLAHANGNGAANGVEHVPFFTERKRHRFYASYSIRYDLR